MGDYVPGGLSVGSMQEVSFITWTPLPWHSPAILSVESFQCLSCLVNLWPALSLLF